MAQIILGLDPGTQFVGFGVLSVRGDEVGVLGHGVLVPDYPEQDVAHRVLELGEAFQQVLTQYKPHDVVVEKSFFHKNADTAFKLGQSRGVFIYEAMRFGANVHEYATRAVKKTVTGQGDADKIMVEMALKNLLPIGSFNSYDASDAVAMAYHHLVVIRTKSLLSQGLQK